MSDADYEELRMECARLLKQNEAMRERLQPEQDPVTGSIEDEIDRLTARMDAARIVIDLADRNLTNLQPKIPQHVNPIWIPTMDAYIDPVISVARAWLMRQKPGTFIVADIANEPDVGVVCTVRDPCRYPACLENEDERCVAWLLDECPGPTIEEKRA